MAEKRMISKAISISEKVNIGLTDIFHMLLYTWIIPHTDDFGRLPGSPAKIKALVVPMLDKSIKDVERGLQEMHETGLIIWYEVDGHKYIQITNFEEHQQGLHKRTKSKIPEFPGNSRNVTEFPSEGKGKEGNRTEEKGTEGNGTESAHANQDDTIKDNLLSLINKMQIAGFNLAHLDIVYSYIGVAEVEVIEYCIKKSQNKPHSYLTNTLDGVINRDKVRSKNQLPGAKVGEHSEKSPRVDQHERTDAEDKPYTGGATGWLPSKFNKNVVQMPKVSG